MHTHHVSNSEILSNDYTLLLSILHACIQNFKNDVANEAVVLYFPNNNTNTSQRCHYDIIKQI